MNERGEPEKLLGGYRALDLTDENGYLCGKILGDLGADVIKIEKPGGDAGRNHGPFYKDIIHLEKSLFWMYFNASKRGITLNIETADGQDIFKKLVKNVDFVLESFPPGYMDTIGLGYAVLSEINPRIILTSITSFGQTGPYKDFQTSDMVIWALGGLMYLTGDPDLAPVRISIPQAHCFGGLQGAVGSLMAHYYRETTGEGQHVDVSTQEAVALTPFFAVETWELQKQNLFRTGGYMLTPRPEPLGVLRHRTIWPCTDGYVCLMLVGGGHEGNVKSSTELTKAAVSEGVALELKDYDWRTMDVSTISQEERTRIEETLMPFLLSKTKQELYEMATEKGILLMPVNNIADMLKSPQLASRQFWVEVEHPELNCNIIYPGAPCKLSDGTWQIQRRAPLIGEHNEEIYIKETGFSKEKLAILKETKVI